MPSYKLLDTPFYGIGLKMYDALAGKAGLGSTEFLSAAKTVKYLPTVQQKSLKGGVRSTGMVSLTMPDWRWRWPARRPRALCSSITALLKS